MDGCQDEIKMTFKISLMNHFSMLKFHIIGTFLMFGTSLIIYSYINIVFVLIWILYSMSVFFIHISYYIYNRKMELIVMNEVLIFKKKGRLIYLKIIDIKSVTLYLPPTKYVKSNVYLLPFECYHYCEIRTIDNKKIIITSLICVEIEDLLKLIDIPYESKRCFYPFLSIVNQPSL